METKQTIILDGKKIKISKQDLEKALKDFDKPKYDVWWNKTDLWLKCNNEPFVEYLAWKNAHDKLSGIRNIILKISQELEIWDNKPQYNKNSKYFIDIDFVSKKIQWNETCVVFSNGFGVMLTKEPKDWEMELFNKAIKMYLEWK